MRKSTAISTWLVVLFVVLSSFGLTWGQTPPTTLIVVIGMDNNLYKMTCDEVSCSGFEQFLGRLRDAPQVTWDDKAQEWVIVGVNENNDIFMGTFNKNGVFNNDWHQLLGRSPVGAGVAGMTIDTLRSLSCGTNQIAKWNGSAWACASLPQIPEAFFVSGAQDFVLGTSGTAAAVRTITTEPRCGKYIVNASGDFYLAASGWNAAQCSITRNTVTVDADRTITIATSGAATFPFAATRGFSYTCVLNCPTSLNFNLVCAGFTGDVRVHNSSMTIDYYPGSCFLVPGGESED